MDDSIQVDIDPIPASELPDPDVVAFLTARADEEADLFPGRAAAMRAILSNAVIDESRWREAIRLRNDTSRSFWAGAVASGKYTLNYLAMAYRYHPDFPEQCRDWRFPGEGADS